MSRLNLRLDLRGAPAMVGASLLLCAAPFARAQAEPTETALMADFLTGTLEIAVPAGDWSAKVYLAPDHTFRETGSDGEVRGAWEVRGGKLCTTVDHALGADRLTTYCNLGPGKHSGEMWRDADPVTGNTVLFKLTPGR
ncbi:MAG: hypothetical protein JSS35_16565 [Proteobacteria bacterium]|nr:hypothetical protein [Pseudomonadota bacterium]